MFSSYYHAKLNRTSNKIHCISMKWFRANKIVVLLEDGSIGDITQKINKGLFKSLAKDLTLFSCRLWHSGALLDLKCVKFFCHG